MIHASTVAGLLRFTLISLFLLVLSIQPSTAAEQVEVVISGVEGDILKNVQGVLHLPEGLLHEGKVQKIWLERFAEGVKEKARRAMEPFGYYHPSITVEIESSGNDYLLRVVIDAGEAVRVRSVQISITGAGEEEEALRRRLTAFPLHQGDVFFHQAYEEGKSSLLGLAQELGYLNAEFTRHEVRILPLSNSASIDLNLVTGSKFYFGETFLSGAPDYPDNFLRRHLTYKKGDLFSYPHLGETQRNFTNSERFSAVNITTELENDADKIVPVRIHLKPAPRISLRPGVGYGTDTGARLTVRYRDLNMFHLGHELYSQLYMAERLQGLVTGYVIPSSKDINSSTTLQMNLQREEVSTYISRIIALEVARNKSFGTGKLGTAFTKFQYEDYTVGNETSFSRLLLPGLRFTENHYDSPVRPKQGYRYALEVLGTHQLLGSDTALAQVLVEGSHLLPLPWRLSLYTRAKVATTLLSDPLSDIPPSLRFFTGGDQSVRGYAYKSLGPKDATGQVIGGKQLLVGSVELERAFREKWGVSLFLDSGNTFESFSTVKLNQGAGVALHYYSPVGALNLSVARPLGVDNPSWRLHFTVGFEL